MQMLNDGHVEAFGAPSPTQVFEGTRNAPGILVTGHDMVDLSNLLKQSEGTPVKVYTHGEMLPAHMYPRLREHPNLAGHFGDAWQHQKREFEEFGGPIVGTTNCVLIPPATTTYLNRFYTTRATAVPGATRLQEADFTPVVKKALEIGNLPERNTRESTIGFHYSVITSIADKVIEAVKTGKVRHFFLIGGCDGAEPGRNYFSDFAQKAPQDSIILTLGCGKYRIRNHDYGTVAGLPRFLDMGQCNDAYGAIQVAVALAQAFGCGVNDLPLSLIISWFEQKAVAVFLTLLFLGVKGIRLGPALPAFITPNVLKVLVDKYDVKPIGASAEEDIAMIYAGKN
jgi:hydroxylamine reductase